MNNMIKTSIENLAEPIGFDIANSDDVVQSALLNGLARGFKTYNDQPYNLQLAYVADKLSSDAERLIKDLAAFVELKQQER